MHNLPEPPPLHTIQTPTSNWHLFRIPVPQIQAHANSLPQKYFSNHPKYTRICYLVITDDLGQVAKVDSGLASIRRGDGFDFGIVVFQDQGQVQEYVGMLGKMGGFEFEQQYEQVMVMVQKMLEKEAIQGVLREQLGWSQSKITHFMERQKIQNISQFLSFRGFNQLQEIALTKIRNCINNMVNGLT